MNETKILEIIEEYYNNLMKELERNKTFKAAMVNPKASNNILFLSSVNISNVIINEYVVKSVDRDKQSYYENFIIKSCVKKRNEFIKELLKKGIFIKNALSADADAASRFSRYVYSEEYYSKEKFNDELVALKNLFDTSTSNVLEGCIKKAVSLVYKGAFTAGSMYSNTKEGYFIENQKEIYDNLTNDTKYWLHIKKDDNKNYPEFIRKNFNELYLKGEIINFGNNFGKEYVIENFLEEIRIAKEIVDQENTHSYNDKQYTLRFLKEHFLNQLYLYSSKESTALQSKYVELLLPLMEKKRESGLSLLKSEFKRNKDEEKELENKSEDKVNLLIELKKSNKKITNLLSFNQSVNIEHIEGLPISIQKLNSKTYSLGIIISQENRASLDDEDILDLKEKYREILLNKCTEVLKEKETNTYNTLLELSFIFAKELRAKQIQTKLSDSTKQNKLKNKV